MSQVQTAAGMSSAANRRVEGFQEDWVKVVHRGQELDPGLSWADAGVDSDGDAVKIVFKELAAEGASVATNNKQRIHRRRFALAPHVQSTRMDTCVQRSTCAGEVS